MKVPVYLFTGFLESGKTTFIKEILKDEDFVTNENSLLILCEEGVEELEKAELEKTNTTVIIINSEDELTPELIRIQIEKCKADRVLIEFNGMWDFDNLYDSVLPKGCEIAQVVCTIDASTFSSYMSNMGSIMAEQFRDADLVVFNRCNKDTKKISLRGSVKAINIQARILFENENGEIDNSEDVLPFDINANVIEPEEYDFGILYEDMMSNPKKYDGKKLKLKVMAYDPDKYPPKFSILGRNAMTCCADDITPLGLICKFENDVELENKEWVDIIATVHKTKIAQYDDELPVLHVEKISSTKKPDEELVYFY
ncbi:MULTISPECIES: TIGR03943 family putative permease subunit [Clostridium]|uniref:TIGR03943 family putative permease subunit n=1 Tax=Clostridium TaxID=1485 RepID=UPI0005EBBF1B|nr:MULTISPECIES: GTP-binding protein [Clostridium]MDU6037829.1 GTP-binding protein [Clostridium butyricum]POO85823.1 GTPase [Clostridium sp. 3-3]UZT04753.1 GTPase [Clostridium sp. LQ25]